ncbi:(2Fe-2S)-binding protein [Rouxiella aceris]
MRNSCCFHYLVPNRRM